MTAVEGAGRGTTGSAGVEVRECTEAERWDGFVAARPDASGYHLWAWRWIFEDVFGHQGHYLVAERDAAVVGILPLVEFRSRIFGCFLVSLPFVNYGGVIAADADAGEALVAAAGRIARTRGARHVELRHRRRRFPALAPKQHKVAMLLPLPATADALWEELDRKVRNQVRKATKSGLTVAIGGAELVPEFYAVFARNMRDLGTPVYPSTLFTRVLETFPAQAHVVVVRHQGRAVAAGVTWRWRETVEVPWASSLREFNAMAPNNLLYWTILEDAIRAGATVLDFGRSTPDEGTFHFKKQWGAEPEALCWEYDVAAGAMPDQSPKNQKFQLAIRLWRRLPLPVANALGPRIVRSIP